MKNRALSYLKGRCKEGAFSLAETYSKWYDPQKAYIKKDETTVKAIYGAGLVQAKDFIEELMKIKE